VVATQDSPTSPTVTDRRAWKETSRRSLSKSCAALLHVYVQQDAVKTTKFQPNLWPRGSQGLTESQGSGGVQRGGDARGPRLAAAVAPLPRLRAPRCRKARFVQHAEYVNKEIVNLKDEQVCFVRLVHLVCLIRLQWITFFVSSLTNWQTTNFHLRHEQTVYGLWKIAWSSFSIFRLIRQNMQIFTYV
jgi:hypothetical protein